MVTLMRCPIGYLKIFRPVVVLDLIAMVNDLAQQERTTEHLLGNEDVLRDVTIVGGPGMPGRVSVDVPIGPLYPATAPHGVSIAACPGAAIAQRHTLLLEPGR